ncbi:amino acid ABC transporter substrate-binding protein [Pseudoduganella ginsengisoli]|uniref:Transporter substrate-binding domain-containing protein n=1 Tax=Pseudoduganella ginsengisoli TaxID=1462440 RepID=A0A6L6Q097_9BURK|nr:ABC transporter substrate-binding protein [Pseudoduganella ginsengisoli]MTW03313.1 transporter substrate-binding domain-containing protein [Pseudoduganella ginsengisoli]
MARCAVFLLALLCSIAMAAEADLPLRIFGMDSRPVSFIEDGKPTGLVVELAQEVQRRLGRSDPIEIVPWIRALSIAKNDRRVLLLSIVPTPERSKTMVYAGPLFLVKVAVFARADRAEALRAAGHDLKAWRTGARRGSIFAHVAQREGFSLTDETNSSDLGARMLMQGRFDLWVEGEETAGVALEHMGYRRSDVVLLRTLSTEDVFFAFTSDTPQELVRAWNDALRDMKRDGTFLRIHRKWLPAQQLPTDMRQPK